MLLKCVEGSAVIHFRVIATFRSGLNFRIKSQHVGAKKSPAFKNYLRKKLWKFIQENTLEPHVENQCFGSLIIHFSALWSMCVHRTWLHNLILLVIIKRECISNTIRHACISRWGVNEVVFFKIGFLIILHTILCTKILKFIVIVGHSGKKM